MGDLDEASQEDLIQMVKDLRQENAGRRTQLRDYEAVFGQFDETTSKGLLNLVGTLATDEKAAAQILRDLSHDILGDDFLEGAPWVEDKEDPEQEENDDMAENDDLKATIEAMRAEIDTMKAEREEQNNQRQTAEDAELEAIIAEAEALGYKRGTPEMAHLFFTASKGDGDLSTAHKTVGPLVGIEVKEATEGEKEEGDEESDEGEENGDPRFPSTSKANAGSPGMEKNESPDSWEQAERAVYAMLDSTP